MAKLIKEKMKMCDYRHAQYVRMDIISKLYKRGYTFREIREEVMARLDLPTYSLQTVHKDVNRLLAEWQETRIKSIDANIQLELQRIDELIKEAWAAWEKSKLDYDKKQSRQVGVPSEESGGENVVTVKMEQMSENVNCHGDIRYLEFINQMLIERRKLLGLYVPKKLDVTTNGKDIAREPLMVEIIDSREQVDTDNNDEEEEE